MTSEQRAERLHHHMYETCEGIADHAERIVDLEELCADLYLVMWACDDSKCPYGDECDDDPDEFIPKCKFKDRMRELGVEVD